MPALNEEGAVKKVLVDAETALKEHEYAIVLVDGRSSDATADIARDQGAYVLTQRRRGYGDALVMGFEHATKSLDPDIIVMMDADGTYDPRDILKVADPILSGDTEMVIGNRLSGMQKQAMTLTNRIGNRLISSLCRHLLGVAVSDTQCGLRAFDSKLTSTFNSQAEGMSFATEMLVDAKEAGAGILEVPIHYYPRIGKTKLSPIRDGLNILGVIIRLLRDYKPLLFFGALGVMSVLFGMLLGLNTILEWIQTGTVRHVPTAVLTVLSISVGVEFISLGLVADMLKGLRRRLQPRLKL